VDGDCEQGISGTGVCICNAGFNGTNCDQCSVGYYGIACDPCLCENDADCNDGMTGNGFCNCKSEWEGSFCNTSVPDKIVTGPSPISPGGIAGIVIAIIALVGAAIAFTVYWTLFRPKEGENDTDMKDVSESDGSFEGEGEGDDFNSDDVSFVEE